MLGIDRPTPDDHPDTIAWRAEVEADKRIAELEAKRSSRTTSYGARLIDAEIGQQKQIIARAEKYAADADRAFKDWIHEQNETFDGVWRQLKVPILTMGAMITAGALAPAAGGAAAGAAAFDVGAAVLPQFAINGLGALGAMGAAELAAVGTAAYLGGKEIFGSGGEGGGRGDGFQGGRSDFYEAPETMGTAMDLVASEQSVVRGGGGLSLSGNFGDFWGDIKGAIDQPGVPAARHDDFILFEGMV